ncbi:MAG TPA: SDR family oxidoreductase [Acidimicrobiales bacterium]|nr:SDR family oxidoreductase [Acidimicrobiales bacterium]
MDLGIAGRVALVTAASKGLGRGAALALAAEGVKVVICARGRDALAETAAAIAEAGGEALAVPADVTEPAQPAALVAAAVRHFGRLDIVVANAGGPTPMTALDVTADAVHEAVEANFLTSVRLVQAAVPHMRANRWGRVCCITSFGVKQPIPGLVLSNTARTALWAWAKTAAPELFADGITLNLLCPGLHATDRVKQLGRSVGDGPLGDPDDFGRVAAFLCSEPAKFVTGTALQVDGGAVVGLL